MIATSPSHRFRLPYFIILSISCEYYNSWSYSQRRLFRSPGFTHRCHRSQECELDSTEWTVSNGGLLWRRFWIPRFHKTRKYFNITLNSVRQHNHFNTEGNYKATCFDYRLVIIRPVLFQLFHKMLCTLWDPIVFTSMEYIKLNCSSLRA